MKRRITKIRAGFTLVEILTTMAVIGILLAFLVPAFTKVQEAAQTARQKAQFHGLGIALEAVYTDMGDYPPSEWEQTDYGFYSGSQRLAEAVVGRDGFGVHQDTVWHKNGTDSSAVGGGNDLYSPDVDLAANPDNLAARFGPYMELENANAVEMTQIFGGTASTPLVYVLTDMYKVVKNTSTGKLGGMPILYYKADSSRFLHKSDDPDASTYNVNDVLDDSDIVSLPVPFTGAVSVHPMKTDAADNNHEWFYNTTQNPNFTTTPRPYRSESFILQSAGPDGLYGTGDDVFNFDQDN